MESLAFDFPGVRIGTAEYLEGPTGCTVFAFDRPMAASADVRGGMPGCVLAGEFGQLRAICFAGGSLLGLEATAGVASAIFAERGHETVAPGDIPAVAGAILYDFDRPNGIYPDKALGAAAYAAAKAGSCPIGRVGAGRNVNVGKGLPGLSTEPGGQGAAIQRVGAATVLAVVVTNALGAIVDRSGTVVRGHLDAQTGRRVHLHEWVAAGHTPAAPLGNTTLTLVLTDQALTPHLLRQFARQVHASMARAIQPFHTPYDGDVLFAVSTGTAQEPRLVDPSNPSALGAVASETVWNAVLNSVGH